MKFLTFIFLFFGFIFISTAQQDPLFSQYMFNGLSINPAIAGSTEQINSSLLYKSVGNSPSAGTTIESFTLHAPFQYQRIGLGFQANNITFGIQKRLSFTGCYAYKINFSKGTLSFGISGGVVQTSLNYSQLKIIENERSNFNDINVILPDEAAGLYYQNQFLSLGISVLHLIPGYSKSSVNDSSNQLFYRTLYVYGAYKILLSEKLSLIPTLLFKDAAYSYVQADLTVHVKYDDFIWGGISYRTNNVLSFQTGIKISDIFKIPRQSVKVGYAYDLYTSEFSSAFGSSNEVMLIMDLSIYKKPSKIRKGKVNISPVFF